MAFVDEMTITAHAGKGGNGVVRWRHTKEKDKAGPSGGDGGNGGNVIIRAVHDLNVLARYRGVSVFRAENGADGFRDEMKGKNGEPCVIEVPVGAHITSSSGAVWDLINVGDEVAVLTGGRGGMGNARFKSSTNQYPLESTPGEMGQHDTFTIELYLIADAGLVGLPNAGKSSLLNTLTKAASKVGAYQFTTLEPHLGVFHSYVLADIPGLIEGAHEGRGLGVKFLRHIRRTRALVHCISAEEPDPSRLYKIVRSELAAYDPELARKPEIIVLTKADTVSAEVLEARKAELQAFATIVPFSILDDALIKKASDSLTAFLRGGA